MTMFADVVTPAGVPISKWAQYLPPTLQLWQVYWIIGVGIAIVGAYKKLPERYQTPARLQSASMVFSCLFALALLGRAGAVYAIGTGMMSSFAICGLYDLVRPLIVNVVVDGIVRRVKAVFGVSSDLDSDLSHPRPSNPENVSTDKIPK